jgi:hypothetical protein
MKGLLMWVIDIRHFLDASLAAPAAPGLARRVKKLGEIIAYATSIEAGIAVDYRPTCWRRPKRKTCPGRLDVRLNPDAGEIHWFCPECGDEGVLSGWPGLIWDMSDCSSDWLH